MPPADFPAQLHDSVSCSIAAAARYGIPANIMLAVAESEAGSPGLWVKNRNGTSDVGSMQFNTAYLATLGKYGITPQAVAAPGCYAYELAAWRLRQHIQKDQGDLWTKAANYHSRTPIHNVRYRQALITKSARWAEWLERCTAGSCGYVPTQRLTSFATPGHSAQQPQQTVARPGYVPRAIVAIPAR
ncbi:transglycosylase SLT domain-containing protein [Pseudoduganella aquatica]|uniref:transglycosylase SLT domain-containing protein n=1 Tax=Pseudoduganella aquatica TaxID=2660641 RepID=UPI001E610882|nr:transglycosylase SLT domain-containing protein [Pseudoduganella aquatica]